MAWYDTNIGLNEAMLPWGQGYGGTSSGWGWGNQWGQPPTSMNPYGVGGWWEQLGAGPWSPQQPQKSQSTNVGGGLYVPTNWWMNTPVVPSVPRPATPQTQAELQAGDPFALPPVDLPKFEDALSTVPGAEAANAIAMSGGRRPAWELGTGTTESAGQAETGAYDPATWANTLGAVNRRLNEFTGFNPIGGMARFGAETPGGETITSGPLSGRSWYDWANTGAPLQGTSFIPASNRPEDVANEYINFLVNSPYGMGGQVVTGGATPQQIQDVVYSAFGLPQADYTGMVPELMPWQQGYLQNLGDVLAPGNDEFVGDVGRALSLYAMDIGQSPQSLGTGNNWYDALNRMFMSDPALARMYLNRPGIRGNVSLRSEFLPSVGWRTANPAVGLNQPTERVEGIGQLPVGFRTMSRSDYATPQPQTYDVGAGNTMSYNPAGTAVISNPQAGIQNMNLTPDQLAWLLSGGE